MNYQFGKQISCQIFAICWGFLKNKIIIFTRCFLFLLDYLLLRCWLFARCLFIEDILIDIVCPVRCKHIIFIISILLRQQTWFMLGMSWHALDLAVLITPWLIWCPVLWNIFIYCLFLICYPWLVLLLLLGIVCYRKGWVLFIIIALFVILVYLIFSLIFSIDFTAIIIWDTLLVWFTLQIVIILIIVLLFNISIITKSIWSHLAWIWSSKFIVELLRLLLLLLRIWFFYHRILLNIARVDVVLIIVILIRSSRSVEILLPSKLVVHLSLQSWMKLSNKSCVLCPIASKFSISLYSSLLIK